jgi:hypothetical protein
LPQGVFELQAYSEGPDATVLESVKQKEPRLLVGDIRLKVKGTEKELNLGTIELVPNKDTSLDSLSK